MLTRCSDHHSYEKAALILHCLRGFLGDESFFKGISYYVSKHKEKGIVETHDFRIAMEESSGRDLESFFDQWVFSPGLPEYNVEYKWKPDTNMTELVVEQTNAGIDGVPLFTTPIETRFLFHDGSAIVKTIQMTEKRSTFFFTFEREVSNVSIDFRNWIPKKKMEFKKPKEMYLLQAIEDENSIERIRACNYFANYITDEAVELLSKVIDDDKFWGVRFEAAKALGEIGTSKALEALLSKRNCADHHTRKGIAHALRNFEHLGQTGVDSAIDALVDISQNDTSYYARGIAATSLGFYKSSERALQAMKSALSQDSINDVVRCGVFDGLIERKEKAGLELAVDYMEKGKNFFGKIAAARLLGKIGGGNRVATEALLSSQKLGHVRVMHAAANAFADLGDTSAIPMLQSWLAKEEEGRVKRALRESIYSLMRKDEFASESLSKIEEKILSISKDTDELRKRITSVEAKNRERERKK